MEIPSSDELNNVKKSLELMYEVSRAIASSGSLDEILSFIVLLTAQVMNSKICSLMLYDEKTHELSIQATQSLSQDYRTKPPVKIGEGVSGKAFQFKKPMAVLDVTADKNFKYPEIAKKEGLKSLVSIPMIVQEKPIGVLNCYTTQVHEFTADEVRLLTSIASQAAIAIKNKEYLKQKDEMEEALETRKKVERAKHILMQKHALSENDAHRHLQQQSMNTRRTVKEIAEAIILSQEIAKPI